MNLWKDFIQKNNKQGGVDMQGKQNKMLVEELLIRTLEGQDKEVQAVLLETFISEYGAISDVNGERVRQVLEQ